MPPRALYERSVSILQALGDVWGQALPLCELGVIAYEQGDYAAACRYLEQGLAVFREGGDKRQVAIWQWYLGKIAEIQHQDERAAQIYSNTWALAREVGHHGVMDFMQRELERLAAPHPPRAPSHYPGGLTEREVEVLRLVAHGLTNAQVAERLVVSVTTVNAHLRSIFSKLSVSSRSAAARFATEHQLV